MAPAAAAVTDVMSSQKRQCWECLRRRLVCDAASPVCNKCLASGIVCPGYHDKKPLVWLAPGKVTSRTRRRNNTSGAAKTSNEQNVASKVQKYPMPPKEGTLSVPPCLKVLEGLDSIIEAGHYCKFFFFFPSPSFVLALSDVCRIDNTQVYPVLASRLLESSPFVVKMSAIPPIPTAMVHLLVSFSLGHRVSRLLQERSSQSISQLRSRLHYHRGSAIRGLNEAITGEATRVRDDTIATVIMFTSTEVKIPLDNPTCKNSTDYIVGK
jgi:hypothetical protein